jgi:hypothetical protein
VEGQLSRLQQIEVRISELQDEVEIKEKTRINLSLTTQELLKEYTKIH